MSERVTDRIAGWVRAALDADAEGGRVDWDLVLVPGQQGLAVLLAAWMPGALLGTVVHQGLMIEGPSVATEQDIASGVRGLLEQLKSDRTAQLGGSGQNGHGAVPETARRGLVQP
jgi:hypothetical protein